jgi:adenine-specific DNA-methyltransferase
MGPRPAPADQAPSRLENRATEKHVGVTMVFIEGSAAASRPICGLLSMASAAVKSISVPNSCVVQTPLPLAHAMINALGKNETDEWLEPCVGNGALLSALSQFGVRKNRITGLDVDARSQPNDRFGNISRGTEFLRWSRTTKRRFDKIVANPPYVALERLDSAIREAAIETSLSETIKVTANGNAWYAFLCASIRLLNLDGSLCFLLPAAWDYANYASPLRNSISRYFSNVQVFRTTTPIFRAERVQEGAIVLLAKGRRDLKDADVEIKNISRHELFSIDELLVALSSDLPKSGVNARLLGPKSIAIQKRRELQPLGNVVSIHLGTVTGDSSYFLLSESRRRELRLPISAVRPVLSKAKHLSSPKITAVQWNELKDADERIWLFNPGPRITDNQYVQSYLSFGLDGGCKVETTRLQSARLGFGART